MYSTLFRVAVVLGLIWLAISFGRHEEFLEKLGWGLILPVLSAQPLWLAAFFFAGRRLGALMAVEGGKRPPVLVLVKALVISAGLNLVLPARLSEVAKVIYLSEKTATSYAKTLAVVMLERTIDLVIMGGVALAAAGLFVGRWVSFVTPIAVVAGIVGLRWGYRRGWFGWVGRLPWPRLRDFLSRFLSNVVEASRPAVFMVALFWGGMMWGASVLAFHVVLAQLGSVPLGPGETLVVWVTVMAGGAVPLLPGGVGTYEAAAVFALKGFGYEIPEALILGIVLHISQELVCGLGTVWMLVVEDPGLSGLTARVKKLRARG